MPSAEEQLTNLGLLPFDCPEFANPDPEYALAARSHGSTGRCAHSNAHIVDGLCRCGRSVAGILGYVIVGDLIYLSGAGPTKADGTNMMGKLGAGCSV
jgi:hypothetical protein